MDDLISRRRLTDLVIGRTEYGSKHEIIQKLKKENSWLGAIVECLDEIEDAPPVKAIPISWIYDYLAQWDSISNRYERPFDDDALADKEYWRTISRRADIGMMVRAWRKEQEEEDERSD